MVFENTSPAAVPYYGFMLLCALFAKIWYDNTKSKQKGLYEHLEEDRRPPVLYLRPFELDGETIPTGPFSSGNPYLGKKFDKLATYETVAIGHAEMIGPVIAIADPRLPANSYFGASREHVNEWQTSVLNFMEQSSLIIMRPWDSPGLLWEFEQIVQRGYLNKTLLYLDNSQKNKKRGTEAINLFSKEVFSRYGINLGDYESDMPFIFFAEDKLAWKADEIFFVPAFRISLYEYFLVPKGKIKNPV